MAADYYSRTSAVAAAGIGRDGHRERKRLSPGGKGYSAFHSVGLDDNTIAAAAGYADAAAVVAAGDEDADDGAYRLLPSSRTTPEAAAAAAYDAVAAVGGEDDGARTGPQGSAEAEDAA